MQSAGLGGYRPSSNSRMDASSIGRRLNFYTIGDVFESSAQVLIFMMVGNSFSRLVITASKNFPLADGLLARIDRQENHQ
jgi:hypothetical protein